MTAVRVLTWNLFHGRDHAPNAALHTQRSRLLGTSESDATHVQTNRDLYEEFSELLAGAIWDVALLQECPPRWSKPLSEACGAEGFRTLTSRNWLLPLSGAVAARRPDLLGSAEGGCNLILARQGAGGLGGTRRSTLRRLPERRTMAFAHTGSGLCVACFHASTGGRRSEEDVQRAAHTALDLAGGRPLVLGGDFNVRPSSSDAFERLAALGFEGTTGPKAIDHLLVVGSEAEPARAWPDLEREIRCGGRALRLSDHAPVERVVRLPNPRA